MFTREINNIKTTLDKTVKHFFNITVSELKNEMDSLEREYKDVDLSSKSYKFYNPKTKEAMCKYQTLKYFNDINIKLDELINLSLGIDEVAKEGDFNYGFETV